MLTTLAYKSLKSRKLTAIMTVIAVAISIYVFVSVALLKQQTRVNFTRAVSGVDLIVGPKTGSLNLLLASIYRIGNVNSSMNYNTQEWLERQSQVDWVLPIAMGDSHRGFRVIATSEEYFTKFKYGHKQSLYFAKGKSWQRASEVVIGSDIAKKLGYTLADDIVLSHGVGVTSFMHHDGYPFKVVGILAKTGTAIDQTLHVSFDGLAFAHGEQSHGIQPKKPESAIKSQSLEHETHLQTQHQHDDHANEKGDLSNRNGSGEVANQIGHSSYQSSAFLVGVKAKYATLMLQQKINKYAGEPIMAIIPGVALTELWQLIGQLETLLSVIASLVLLAALFGLATMLLATMKERKQELAIFRSLGASPKHIFALVQLEVMILTFLALVIATVLFAVSLGLSGDWLAQRYGLYLQFSDVLYDLGQTSLIVFISAFVVGCIPSYFAFRESKSVSIS
ncbi:ABC transporter permease [Psychrosphaera sp. 1_MG-2023]|nr:ABC transporter permease [Psychrosphaera sp. 1_MG-2023]MDO6719421.1 ABC transporter permease [Psychrosphaera sp. 1_MG-2023]